jgi:hypothetical protein
MSSIWGVSAAFVNCRPLSDISDEKPRSTSWLARQYARLLSVAFAYSRLALRIQIKPRQSTAIAHRSCGMVEGGRSFDGSQSVRWALTARNFASRILVEEHLGVFEVACVETFAKPRI